MEITRRTFIKSGGLGLLGAVILPGSMAPSFRGIIQPDTGQPVIPNSYDSKEHYWRFIVDIRKCIGCGKCVRACKQENDVPMDIVQTRTWIERYVVSQSEEIFVDSPNAGIDGFSADYVNNKYQNLDIMKSFFVPKLCNHCQAPPCVQVCPVGATYSSKEGVVLVDRHACIGCRYCIQACPYGARFLDPRLKVVDKCTWCYHRTSKGLLTACVEACPTGARLFGDTRDPESPVSKILKEETLGILKPEIGCEPMVYYVGLERGVR